MAVLGVSAAAGVLWLALVDDGALVASVDRVEQPTGMSEGRAWREMLETLTDLLRDTKPTTVAVLDPGTYKNLPWTPTRGRVAIETVLTMACDAADIALERVAHATVKVAVGARPTDAALSGLLAGLVPAGPPPRWNERMKAAAAAVTAGAA